MTAVPPGQYPPFATVTDEDHSAWIIIATALGVSFAFVALATRIFIRKFVNPAWALDDTVLGLATGIFFVQSSIILVACSDGLGTSVELVPLPMQLKIQKLYYASNFFYLYALDLSKLSSILFVRRLTFPGTSVRRFTTLLAILVLISTVVFTLAIGLQCELAQPWIILHQRCPGWFERWESQAIVSSLLEIGTLAALVWLIRDLQQPRQMKAEVIVPFALRLIIIIATGLRLNSFNGRVLSTNPTLGEAKYICWTQAELSYSVISATFPTARRLVLDLITYYNGGQFTDGVSGAVSLGDTIHLSTLSPRRRRHSAAANLGSVHDEPLGAHHDSQEMIIRKDILVEVKHENEMSE